MLAFVCGLSKRLFDALPTRGSSLLTRRCKNRRLRNAFAILLLLSAWFVLGTALQAQQEDADQVILDNGDHFTGKIVDKTAETVLLSTDYAGIITIRQSAIKTVIAAPQPVVQAVAPTAAPQPVANCKVGSRIVPSAWQFGFDGTPDKVVLGTQSQEQFGANAQLNFCEGSPRDTTNLFASGSHSRTYKENSTAIHTDLASAQLEQQHFFKSTQGASIFGVVEEFTNNSLGMAAEKSAGIGLTSPKFHSGNLNYNLSIDARYIGEHLDHTAAHLDLAALRIMQEMHLQGKFAWDEQVWIMPTLNDIHALQGYASAGPAITVKSWLKVSLNEEEYYLGNAPAPNRKNYFASTLKLTIQGGSGIGSK
jgi:hypothetical protein